MSDFTFVTIGFAIVSAVVVSFLAYSIYGGTRASLTNASVGDVLKFEYEQPLHGEHKRFLARVVEPVYTLDDSSIKRLNRTSRYRRNDPVFQRTKNLVVCETPDGKIRQFYAERVKNCRKPLLASVLFKTGLAASLV
jgi:hypothetical protein